MTQEDDQMAIQKVNKSSVSTQVFEQMKEQLLSGEWKPGDKLPSENELASMFGVSRVTVRNALQKLAALELVETHFGEGTFVKETQTGASFQQLIPTAYFNDNSLWEILTFRRITEGQVCELACKSASAEDIDDLEVIYRKMEETKDDLKAFSSYDFQFHLQLAKITRNSIFVQIYNIVSDVLTMVFDSVVLQRGNQAGLYYHEAILKAFKDHDSDAARKLMDQHMQEMYDTYFDDVVMTGQKEQCN
jgi:GntR family transcriptional repressor for pyruvate dehydrogenase complex